MKKLLFLLFFTVAPHAIAEKPTFEFWNKSGDPIAILLKSSDAFVIDSKPTTIIQPGERIQKNLDIAKPTMLMYFNINKKNQFGKFNRFYYSFTLNKTIYVRLGIGGKKFGPQTGPLGGWTYKTQSGLPLTNNVTQKDIQLIKLENK